LILSLVTTIIAAVNVIATYFAFRWIDKFDRRKLSMGGYAGMAVSAVVAGLGLLLLTGMPEIVVMMIALNAFVASFAIGVGGTGWLLQGEVFPTAVRGQAAAIAACVDWTANFALIEVFPTWQTGIGLGWIMICFAVTCLLAIGFISKFLPEPKNHSVEDVAAIFEQKAQGGPVLPSAVVTNAHAGAVCAPQRGQLWPAQHFHVLPVGKRRLGHPLCWPRSNCHVRPPGSGSRAPH